MKDQGRRRFLRGGLALAGMAVLGGCGVVPPQGQQPAPPRRIGFLSTQRPDPDPYAEALRQALRDLGWVEKQNLAVEYRYAEGQLDRLPTLAADLVRLGVELIHASGTPAALAVRQASTAIPIVIATAGDPVAQGLAASLSHPGGNVTGLTSIAPELTPKRVELLKAAVPGAMRMAVVRNPTALDYPTYQGFLRGVEAAAQAYGLELHWMDVSGPDRTELADAFAGLMRTSPDVLFIIPDPVTQNLRGPIAELALRYRLPSMGDSRDSARAGQFIGYGPSFEDQYSRSAAYVDKILKGAKPADLPIERPTKFDLVVNLKTAQALGLTIPQSVLAQATEIIQ